MSTPAKTNPSAIARPDEKRRSLFRVTRKDIERRRQAGIQEDSSIGSRLRALDSPEAEEEIVSEERELRPALSIIDDIIYVTVPLLRPVEQGKSARRPFVIARDLTTGDRRRFELTLESVHRLQLHIKRDPKEYVHIPRRRWSLRSIKNFLTERPHLVTAAEVFDGVCNILPEYVEFQSDDDRDIVALWVIATYFFQLFRSFPYIYVGGERGSGKTTLLNVVGQLAFNAVFSANMTPSALFRTVDITCATCLMDEMEEATKKEQMQELRQLLRSGYSAGALVHRSRRRGPEEYEPEEFEVYSPKMLAAIDLRDPVLLSRCIVIRLLPTRNPDISGKEPRDDERFRELRDDLYHYLMGQGVKDVLDAIKELPSIPLAGRNADLWRPLLTIAWRVDSKLYERMLEITKEKTLSAQAGVSAESNLGRVLLALKDLVRSPRPVRPREVSDYLQGTEDEQYPIPTSTVGKILRNLSFKILPRGREGVRYYLTPEDVGNRVRRFLGPELEEAEEEQVSPVAQPESDEELKPGSVFTEKALRERFGGDDAEAVRGEEPASD